MLFQQDPLTDERTQNHVVKCRSKPNLAAMLSEEVEYCDDKTEANEVAKSPAMFDGCDHEETTLELTHDSCVIPEQELRHEYEPERDSDYVEDEREASTAAAPELSDDGLYYDDDEEELNSFQPALTREQQFIQEVLIAVPADISDKDRLRTCAQIAHLAFDVTVDEYSPSLIVHNAEQLGFSRPPSWDDVDRALRDAPTQLEFAEVADIIGMVSPSWLKTESAREVELITGVVPAAQVGTISAPKNGLKTKTAIDLGISLATGTKFLDHFPVDRPVRAGIIAGEDSQGDIDEAIDRICHAKGVDRRVLDGPFFVSTRVPRLGNEDWRTAMRRFIELARLEYLCIEAGYLGLGGPDQRVLHAMGDALAPLKQLCDDTGCTIQLAAHHKYARSAGWPTLNDISGVGYEELSRYWFLLKPVRSWDSITGQHCLRLVIGNKRSERKYVLNVREGNVEVCDGRVWEVKLSQPGQTAAGERHIDTTARGLAKCLASDGTGIFLGGR